MDTLQVRRGAGAARGLRQVISVHGPDTVSYLQGQLSQDIAAMAPGESRWSLLLQPQGKIAAWLRVTRTGDTAFLLDVDTGWADQVMARLERFKLRTKCDLAIVGWTSLTVVGAAAFDVAIDGAETEVHDSWAGLPVVVAFGESLSADAPELSADVVTALRIETGRPAMGAELDESTIPAAAGIVEQSVSFAKGCYTGQELVARIDSRGNNVPRRLVGVILDGPEVPEPGAVLSAGGADVGQLTSTGFSAVVGSAIALAYVTRAVPDGAAVNVTERGATVHPLPLVKS